MLYIATMKNLGLESEISFKTSRSGGAGGQHVNKVATKVELSFSINNSKILTQDQKKVLLENLSNKLTKDGILLITAQSERTQLGNKKVVLKKFYKILGRALAPTKKRIATKPSKASKEKRLLTKKKRAEIKKQRQKNF